MTLDLDTRQRAMLQEMGVRVWWPEAPSVPVAAPLVPARSALSGVEIADASAERSAPAEALTPDRAVTGVLAEDIASMDWTTLASTIAGCRACKQGIGCRAPVFAAAGAARQSDWLVLGEPPDDIEERQGAPFAGQAGQLLDNMLKAVGVRRCSVEDSRLPDSGVARLAYVTNVVKCRPSAARNPELQDIASCENYLRREVALVQPKVILALGRFAAQALLQGALPGVASIPLGKLRGQVYRYQGIPVIVSYHPAYLLRTPQDKARAWLDLCLALQLATGPIE
jgi:DNA polymerase